MSQFQNNLTEGSVSKNLIKFSLPFLLSNFIQSLYSMADLFIVSMFNGPESIAGVNLGSQFTMLITMLVLGLVTGGTIMIAQYIGAKREDDMKETISTLFTLMCLLAVVFTVVLITFADVLLGLINTPPEAFEEAKSYFIICVSGLIFIFGYNAVSAVLRGMGDSKNPLKFVTIAATTNVFLDLLLVGVFDMKAGGAAIATVIAQALSLIISIIYLIRRRFAFDFKLKSFIIHKDKLKKLLSVGLPTSLQNSISSISFLTLTSLINAYGVYASAGVGIVGKINSFAIMPTAAMSASIAAMAAQNIGAGHYDRAKKTMHVGRNIALVIGGTIFLLIQLFPHAFIGVFTDDPIAMEYGTAYVRSFSFDYIVVPFAFCAAGLLTGSGNTLFVSFASILCSLLLRIPTAQILSGPMNLGLFGIGLAVPVSTFGNYVLSAVYIATGKWKNSKITGPVEMSDTI